MSEEELKNVCRIVKNIYESIIMHRKNVPRSLILANIFWFLFSILRYGFFQTRVDNDILKRLKRYRESPDNLVHPLHDLDSTR